MRTSIQEEAKSESIPTTLFELFNSGIDFPSENNKHWMTGIKNQSKSALFDFDETSPWDITGFTYKGRGEYFVQLTLQSDPNVSFQLSLEEAGENFIDLEYDEVVKKLDQERGQ